MSKKFEYLNPDEIRQMEKALNKKREFIDWYEENYGVIHEADTQAALLFSDIYDETAVEWNRDNMRLELFPRAHEEALEKEEDSQYNKK